MLRSVARVTLFLLSALVLFSACHSSRQTTDTKSATKKQLSTRELKKKYAGIMHTTPGEIRNKKLYAFIDSWYGVKHKYGGRSRSGIDCSGLVCQLYKDVYGITLERSSVDQYEQSRHFRRKRKFDEGDLIFFTEKGKEPNHVGVFLQNGFFVHTSTSKGVTISHISEKYWKDRYKGGGKVR
jgi:cell wall-associated NlpC family hydrolase